MNIRANGTFLKVTKKSLAHIYFLGPWKEFVGIKCHGAQMSINLLRLVQVNTHPCLDTKPAHDLCGVLARGLSLEVIKCMVILEHVGPVCTQDTPRNLSLNPYIVRRSMCGTGTRNSLAAGSESSYQDQMRCPGTRVGRRAVESPGGGRQPGLFEELFILNDAEFEHTGKEARREGCREELRNHRCQSTKQEVIATNSNIETHSGHF